MSFEYSFFICSSSLYFSKLILRGVFFFTLKCLVIGSIYFIGSLNQNCQKCNFCLEIKATKRNIPIANTLKSPHFFTLCSLRLDVLLRSS